jgi:uncharacterized protein (DUF4415 family)
MSNSMHPGTRYRNAPSDVAEEIKASELIPDDFPGPEELRRELKKSVTIRLDPDIFEWFQLPRPGHQTRINAILRAYMDSRTRAPQRHVANSQRHVFVKKKLEKRGALSAGKKARAAKKKVARARVRKGSGAKRKPIHR